MGLINVRCLPVPAVGKNIRMLPDLAKSTTVYGSKGFLNVLDHWSFLKE